MAVVVKLQAVLEAMNVPREWEAFLDPETGEIVTISEEDSFSLDDDEDSVDELPEWEQEASVAMRRVLESGRAIRLPDSYDINEWELMRRFSEGVENQGIATELLNAIRGTGAFRSFKDTVARVGLREAWFEYRDEALRDMARAWLESHGIPYVDDSRRSHDSTRHGG